MSFFPEIFNNALNGILPKGMKEEEKKTLKEIHVLAATHCIK